MSTLYQGFVISGVRNTRTPLYQRLVTLEIRYIRHSSYWGFDMARISWMGWGGGGGRELTVMEGLWYIEDL